MRGLSDAGGTCFVNAALQCLLFSPPLTNYILSGLATKDLCKRRVNACAMTTEYMALTKAFWTIPVDRMPCADTNKIVAALRKAHKPFAGDGHRDAHEALRVLLRHMHEAWAKAPRIERSLAAPRVNLEAWEGHIDKEGYSPIVEMFMGQEAVLIDGDAYREETHEHFLVLSLEACASVTAALRRHLEPRTVQGFVLPGGGIATVTKSRRVTYFPLILTIHLKRFDPSGSKIDRFVSYSTTLDLADLGGGVYDLFGVVFHGNNHYTAACEAGGKWHMQDDGVSTPIENINALVHKDAYVLMYKKRSSAS